MTADDGPYSLDLTVIPEAPVPVGFDEASLRPLVSHVLAAERARGAWSVSIVFATDAALQRLHARFMGLDSPTDILTFPYADEGSAAGDDPSGGDIAISVDRAKEQAAEEGWSLDTELRFLVAHGLLHLLGWDDAMPAERAAMLARQRELLSEV